MTWPERVLNVTKSFDDFMQDAVNLTTKLIYETDIKIILKPRESARDSIWNRTIVRR